MFGTMLVAWGSDSKSLWCSRTRRARAASAANFAGEGAEGETTPFVVTVVRAAEVAALPLSVTVVLVLLAVVRWL